MCGGCGLQYLQANMDATGLRNDSFESAVALGNMEAKAESKVAEEKQRLLDRQPRPYCEILDEVIFHEHWVSELEMMAEESLRAKDNEPYRRYYIRHREEALNSEEKLLANATAKLSTAIFPCQCATCRLVDDSPDGQARVKRAKLERLV